MDIAIQYLEPNPETAVLRPFEVRERLRAALATLPITRVILGWNVSEQQVEVCAEETVRAKARLIRWQPLLSDDGTLQADPAWQTIGLDGNPVPGDRTRRLPVLLCPNRPAVREAILGRIANVIRDRRYQGIFLDHIHFPSPAVDPARFLACFCEDCERAAAELRFDLPAARELIRGLVSSPDQAEVFVKLLIDNRLPISGKADLVALDTFLDFRMLSITRIVQAAAEMIRQAGLEVSIDCLAPSLARTVGQDYQALDVHSDWIKASLYYQTLGPAGLPFELLALADWLTERHQINQWNALMSLSDATRLPFPPNRAALREQGLTGEALGAEVWRARGASTNMLLAGIDLVQTPGIAGVSETQLLEYLSTLKTTSPQGLVLAWDLQHIPPRRLDLLRRVLAN